MDGGSAALWPQTQDLKLGSEATMQLSEPNQRNCVAEWASTGSASRLCCPALRGQFYHGLRLAQAHVFKCRQVLFVQLCLISF